MSMKNVGDLMKRLQKMMPAHVEPAFKTGEELLAWQKEQGKLRSEALERENRAYPTGLARTGRAVDAAGLPTY